MQGQLGGLDHCALLVRKDHLPRLLVHEELNECLQVWAMVIGGFRAAARAARTISYCLIASANCFLAKISFPSFRILVDSAMRSAEGRGRGGVGVWGG